MLSLWIRFQKPSSGAWRRDKVSCRLNRDGWSAVARDVNGLRHLSKGASLLCPVSTLDGFDALGGVGNGL